MSAEIERRPAAGTDPLERPFWVAFSHVPGIGPARFALLCTEFGGARAAWQAPERALNSLLDRRSREALLDCRRRLEPEALTARLAAQGIGLLTWDDPAYPALLRQIALPPYLLFTRGDVGLLAQRSVAVVGAREPTRDGRRTARAVAGELAARGLVIVSGLARGIDAEAHAAALEQGQTVAVLGTGPDVTYPAANHRLQAHIAATGALVTEYPPGSSTEPGNFVARNRIISGLCLATVVVEAGLQSGALVTAAAALEQGREVLAVPGSIYIQESKGCNQLLADGAGVCRSVDDVLGALRMPLESRSTPPREPPADPAAAAVLTALTAGPAHIDELARMSGLDATQVARALSWLELAGHAEHLGAMRWAAC